MGVYVVRTSSLNDKHSCQLFRKASSLVLLSSSVSTANLSCLLVTTFSSLRFLFNFTSLQSFESGQALFLVVFYFLIFRSYPQSSAFLSCSSVSEALFTLSFSFLSECFFFFMIKLLQRVVEKITRVHSSVIIAQNDFEHARGLRNSAYAVNLTYDRHTDNIYIYIFILYFIFLQ